MNDDSTLADRTYRAAVTMWASSGVRGPKPERSTYDHLNAVPDVVPAATAAAPALVGSAATPAPLDAATGAAVKAALAAMRADQPRASRQSATPGDAA